MERKINPRREELKALSAPFAILKKQGAIETINEGLADYYRSQGFKDLKSLPEWNTLGRLVRKGEKALLLWGSPRPRNKEQAPEQPEPIESTDQQQEEKRLDFYPIAYVFDITQTEAA